MDESTGTAAPPAADGEAGAAPGAGRGAAAAPRAGNGARSLLAEPAFRRLWTVGAVVFVVRWIEMIAIGVFVYRQTGSAFLVAMMTMLRLLPLGLLGAVIGAAAERVERRAALLAVVLGGLAVSAAMALLAHAGQLAVWHVALGSFLNGIGWAADNPVRRLMIGEAVGPERMGTAMSLDVGANNASRIFGPTLGGALYAAAGIEGAFALGALLHLVALGAALRVGPARAAGAPAAAAAGVLGRMAEGVAAVRQDRRLTGILAVTVIFNLFGWPFTSMIPVIGQDRLGLGPDGIGLLASVDGVGAFGGAVALALWARPRHYRACYVGGVTLYLATLIAFALAPQVWLAAAALLLTGLAQAGFATMQATLVFLAAPPEMRSRVLGLLSVCIGTGPLGFVALGLLAEAVGASAATAAMGLAGLAALAATRRWWGRI
ncbi:MFS transporter [Caldovatus aquaticus]|uniref:MFS transporter n=1 Tax=Caldovatus aquaticus TaxID=2865671 RepID=A0ABS7F3X9_9PROT|nr:MFS transporter [Caldovatus aquaticus]